MFKKGLLECAVALLLMFSIAGCGSDGNSNTNGQLTLTADAPVSGGYANLNATATVIPGSGITTGVTPGLPGADIDFIYSQYGPNGEIVVKQTSESRPTNSLGVATFSKPFQQSQDMLTTIQITAKYYGLASETKYITVTKYVP